MNLLTNTLTNLSDRSARSAKLRRMAAVPAIERLEGRALFNAIVMTGGPGVDHFNLSTVNPGDTVTINGMGGNDVVTISPTYNMQSIAGDVTLNNPTGSFLVYLINQSDSGSRNVTLTSNSITGLSPGTIHFTPSQISTMAVYLGSGTDTFNATSVGCTTQVFTRGGGHHSMLVSNAGHVQNITGELDFIADPNTATLTIDDSADVADRTLQIDSQDVSGLSTKPVFFTGMTSVAVKTGKGKDTVYVSGTLSPTTVTNFGGSDSVLVGGAANGMQQLTAPLSILDTGGPVNIGMFNQQDLLPRSVTLNKTSIVGLAPATISFSADCSYYIYGSSGASTYHILGTPTGGNNYLEGGPANDTFNVDGTNGTVNLGGAGGVDTLNLTPTGKNLNSLQGYVSFSGDAGTDTVNINDSANAASNVLYYFQQIGMSRPGFAGLTFSTTELVNLLTGNGGDTVDATTVKSPTAVFNFVGGTGNDTFLTNNCARRLHRRRRWSGCRSWR